jgi:hypothetical protein
MSTSILRYCPQCRQVDSIQKVSSVYEGGISTVTYEQPVIQGSIYDGSGHIDTYYERHTATFKSNLARRLAPPSRPLPHQISTISHLISVFSDKVRRQQIEEKERHADNTTYWEIAMGRWSLLYYCRRCDGVFLPSRSRFVPIDQILDYLYDIREKFVLHTEQTRITQAVVSMLAFYESAPGYLDHSQRVYEFDFDQTRSRYINWCLHIDHQKTHSNINIPLKALYYRSDGRICSEYQTICQIPSGWVSSVFSGGWGYPGPGEWDGGRYQVTLYLNYQEVANSWFWVRD